MPTTVKQLLDMSQQQLDDLFRASPAGPIPAGDAAGTAIVRPGTDLADVAAQVVNKVAWQGKVFDPSTKTLRNKVTPLGVQEIAAEVYVAPSWFDNQECIVLDYSKTSTVAQAVRDEIREVRPGLYLGIVFIGEHKTINFALEFGGAAPPAGPWQRFTSRLRGLFGRKTA